jgi:PAS domain S-box-containing protein
MPDFCWPSLFSASLRQVSKAIALTAATFGLVVMAGWLLAIPALTNALSGITMKFNTALALGAAGVSLFLWAPEPTPSIRRQAGRAAAMVPLLIGGLTLVQYLAGIDLGIDQLLFHEPPGVAGTLAPGRMTPNTSAALILLGAALMLFDWTSRAGGWPAGWLAVLSGAIGLTSLIDFALLTLEGSDAINVGVYRQMARYTAWLLVGFAFGVSFARPNLGLVRTTMARTAGGAVARQLLPAAFVIPLLLGWLRYRGELQGWYDKSFGVAGMAVVTLLLLMAVIVRTSEVLNRSDEARKQGEDALRVWANIFKHAGWGVATATPDGKQLVMMNETFAAMHGSTIQALVGTPVAELFPAELRAGVADRLAQIRGETHVTFETRHLRKDGTTFPVLADLVAVREEQGAGIFPALNVQDITGLKRVEEELRRAKEAAEATGRELEAFSYSVSHDLRAPLRSIDGFSQALLEDYGATLDETAQDHLRRVRKAAQRMSELIDDLLQLSKVTRSELKKERVDLTAVAHEVAAELILARPKPAVALEIDEGLYAWCDRRLVRVVLENLLSNAWKFTSKREGAIVRFKAAADGSFYVEDNGAGFDMAYANKLFGAFQRLHAAKDFEGTGIGLATVFRVVQRHGGKVWAEGKPGQGAKFSFTLGDRSPGVG